MQHLAPPTPLTGRKYLRTKDTVNTTPSPAEYVMRLQAMLAGQVYPSDNLQQILNTCSQDVKSLIETKVKELGEHFYTSYTQCNDTNETMTLEFRKKRLHLGQALFYRLLEMILKDEKRRKANYDATVIILSSYADIHMYFYYNYLLLQNLLGNALFLQCLFACCLEIVIYSYKSNDRTFPWILNAFNLEAYDFYKVIEIIVRAEDQLSRDVVKHLNKIEETILESLAWRKDSPLWQAIERYDGGVPSCEEVSLPGTLETIDPNTPGQPVLRKFALDRGTHHDVQQSPVSSASERYIQNSIRRVHIFNQIFVL